MPDTTLEDLTHIKIEHHNLGLDLDPVTLVERLVSTVRDREAAIERGNVDAEEFYTAAYFGLRSATINRLKGE